MKKTFLIIVLLLICLNAFAQDFVKEVDYQNYLLPVFEGIGEYRLPDMTRIDILTTAPDGDIAPNGYAIELDFAEKWAEGIGQAEYYAIMTNRRAGVVLILEKSTSYDRYIARLLTVAFIHDITVWTIDHTGILVKIKE